MWTRTWMTMLLALGACGQRSATDVASVCIEVPGVTTGADASLAAPGTVVTGEWALTATASAGCHTSDLQVFCDVEVEGDTLYVTVEQSWVRTEPLSMNCEMALRQTTADCDVGALDDGEYTVVYADQEMGLSLPEPVPACIRPDLEG